MTNAAEATLEIDAANGDLPNAIVIDNFVATGESYSNGVLTLTSATGSVIIDVANAGANFGTDLTLSVVNGVTTITGMATSWTNVTGGDWSASATNWSSIVPAAANDATIAPVTSTAAYTVSIASGESALAHSLTINDAYVTLDDVGSLTLIGGFNLEAGTFHLDGGNLQVALPINIANGATFEGSGTVAGLGNGTAVSGTVIASDAGGPALDFASAVTGSGNFQINAGATLEFGSSVASGATVTFGGGTGELKLDAPGSFAATIAGFTGTQADATHSDVIDLAGINETSANFHETYAGGVLTVTDGTNTAELTFSNFTSSFKFASDGNGGTLIFDPPSSAAPNAAATVGTPVAPGHNFAFRPGLGAEGPGTFDPGRDTFDLNHFVNPSSATQWMQLVFPEDHGHATIEPGHAEGTIPGMTPQHLQAVLASVIHLH